jgi:hypothetical protein
MDIRNILKIITILKTRTKCPGQCEKERKTYTGETKNKNELIFR